MTEVAADIFAINETHADKMNLLDNQVLESSRQRMFSLSLNQKNTNIAI